MAPNFIKKVVIPMQKKYNPYFKNIDEKVKQKYFHVVLLVLWH